MLRSARWALLVIAAGVGPLGAQEGTYSIKETMTPVPKEVKASIAQLLGERSVQLVDGQGNLLMELWLRKDVPATATPEQVKNGLSYAEVPETTLLGVVQLAQPGTDYRKQKLKAGLYTLRLGIQPMDGDHQG